MRRLIAARDPRRCPRADRILGMSLAKSEMKGDEREETLNIIPFDSFCNG